MHKEILVKNKITCFLDFVVCSSYLKYWAMDKSTNPVILRDALQKPLKNLLENMHVCLNNMGVQA
jgi:hypothetical protein